jgi:acetyltransferase-like isoleucine patch superfamily enzyme
MRTNLKQQFKRVSNKYPMIGSILMRIHLRKPLNSIKRKIKGRNNRIIHNNAILSSVLFDISGNGNTIEIMGNCILNNIVFYVRGNGHRVLIQNGCRFNRGGNIWFEDNNCSLSIGENTTFENVHLALTEPNSKITIGQDCMFAYDIDVRTGDSHSIISQPSNKRINFAEDIFIGNHVWVAAHCNLLKGCLISDNSVVATGSVVTQKYYSKGIIIGGNPAKQIKDGITWTRNRIYKKNEQ